jgi:uncharacterized protein YndB with AHSA1/START domain
MSSATVAHDTFVIERTYDASAAQVFKAWSDPALKSRWFAGGAEVGESYDLDFRVGGKEINRGGPPGGLVYTYDACYQDIVADQRIVYTYQMYAGDDRISVSVATVELHPDGARTRLVFTEQGVFLDGLDTVAQREEGTQSLLDALGASLAA